MVAAANKKISVNKSNEKHKKIDRCSICGKKAQVHKNNRKPIVMLAVYDS
ncbi:MAG: hypothetical protein ICV56_09715 [Nitrososphaeraceae archaeon]|jgi:ribosomal protein S14|nr:hypothetical protein [Nitrososphaeraceae archaeon]